MDDLSGDNDLGVHVINGQLNNLRVKAIDPSVVKL